MHELHLIKNLPGDVLEHARKSGIQSVKTVYLRLGGFDEINPEILMHYFKEHSRDTAAAGAEIRIEPSGGVNCASFPSTGIEPCATRSSADRAFPAHQAHGR